MKPEPSENATGGVESVSQILSSGQIANRVCDTLDRLIEELNPDIGVLLVSRNNLTPNVVIEMSEAFRTQPAWSQFPIVILAEATPVSEAQEATILEAFPWAVFLNHPPLAKTLLSVVRAALRDRERQLKVRSLTLQLERAKSDAERANRAKSDFLANMSHEIRTPLGAVLGFSEMLIDSDLASDDRLNYVNAIGRNGKLLLALINDILDLAKVEAGRVDIENIEISLKEFFSEVISALQPLALLRNVSIELLEDDDAAEFIKTDPLRLKQILINIAGNAVKFSQDSKVTIRVKSHAANSDLERLVIDVIDRGVGIAPLGQARLFQPFMQGDTSSTREYGGTGLGLTLSRQLARLMGGDITLVKSEPNVGSVFRIELLVGQVASAILNERRSKKSGTVASTGEISGLKLLLVEDSPDNRVLIGRILKNSGACLETANDGLEGLTKALADEYDVVIMDVQMPRLDGYQAAAQLRQRGYDGPIIALTAHALKGERERCLSAGYNEYLTKPVDRKALVSAIANLSSTHHH